MTVTDNSQVSRTPVGSKRFLLSVASSHVWTMRAGKPPEELVILTEHFGRKHDLTPVLSWCWHTQSPAVDMSHGWDTDTGSCGCVSHMVTIRPLIPGWCQHPWFSSYTYKMLLCLWKVQKTDMIVWNSTEDSGPLVGLSLCLVESCPMCND